MYIVAHECDYFSKNISPYKQLSNNLNKQIYSHDESYIRVWYTVTSRHYSRDKLLLTRIYKKFTGNFDLIIYISYDRFKRKKNIFLPLFVYKLQSKTELNY